MNKLTKVGFSALCGSLAAISTANAGDLTVTGGVDMSWISLDNSTTGNPIGIGSNLTFKGSGELDNGWKFDLTVANTNANAYSAATVNLDMGMLGKLNFDQGSSGNGIAAFDNKMPTAWEEPWGNGLSSGVKTVLGSGGSDNIMYTTPTVLGITLTATHAPTVGSSDTADKASSGVRTTKGHGYDGTININPSFGTELLSGLDLFVGGHYTDVMKNSGTGYEDDIYEAVAGVTFDIGPLSIGYGQDGFITGESGATAGVSHYRGEMYGVAFNVNDDLSVSYGFNSTRKEGYVNCSSSCVNESGRKVEVQSTQIAYTMGGASLRLADTRGKNVGFTAANDIDATVISVSLAF